MSTKSSPAAMTNEIDEILQSIKSVKGPQHAVITEAAFNVINIVYILDSAFGPMSECSPHLQNNRRTTLTIADGVIGNMIATMVALWKNPNNLDIAADELEGFMKSCHATVEEVNRDVKTLQIKQSEYSA